ncbi:AAA family ATPase [uncultured Jatrophihabitans sp.]|uniref:AAA family ATPase n=1 Tax=uncultured Jatrophihabitans sp. TaxID=1610747 RepID=UPI0035CC898E
MTEPSDSTDPRAKLIGLRAEVGKAVVGQDAAVTGLLVGLLCRGHVLIEGVPGTAKTLLVRALAAALDLATTRIQFTADLMPGDITGSLIYDAGTSNFVFREGPVFTNLLLADEINRTPPKTQSALLEAMEERQVSVDGRPRPLPDPFCVIATQNPVEYEGTYPLPEAQLDRFLLKVTMPLPDRETETRVLAAHAAGFDPRDLAGAGLRAVAGAADLAAATQAVRATHIDPAILAYIVELARATRAAPSAALGASPRGATALLATSRAWAWLSGRDFVTPDDVQALARPTLRHRIQLRPEAEIEGVTTDGILENVLASVPVPR